MEENVISRLIYIDIYGRFGEIDWNLEKLKFFNIAATNLNFGILMYVDVLITNLLSKLYFVRMRSSYAQKS